MNITRTLFDTSKGIHIYIGKAFLIAIVPVLTISAFFSLVLPDLEGPAVLDESISPLPLFFIVVLLTPLLETLMMWPMINIIRGFTRNYWQVAFISASVWAVLHSLQAFTWGFVIFWTFVVLSISFQVWREVSRTSAVLVTASIHACQNFLAFVGTMFLG